MPVASPGRVHVVPGDDARRLGPTVLLDGIALHDPAAPFADVDRIEGYDPDLVVLFGVGLAYTALGVLARLPRARVVGFEPVPELMALARGVLARDPRSAARVSLAATADEFDAALAAAAGTCAAVVESPALAAACPVEAGRFRAIVERRLAARAGTAPPAADLAAARRDLAAAMRDGTPADVLAAADDFKDALHGAVANASGHELFAKLVALKLSNLALSRWHEARRHARVAAFPYQLMIDPANGCQLHCPGCVHSRNAGTKFDWPAGLLDRSTYARLMDAFAPYALAGIFFNYGEPLLNRQTPDLVREAKRRLLFTSVSSNLSLKVDADALAASGLDVLIVSLDGASPETYARYRKGGRFDTCVENVRRIVAARDAAGHGTPRVVWQFLTFEHNVHELDRALEMARELGVDDLSIGTPFDVSWDDPGVRVARSDRAGWTELRPGARRRNPHDASHLDAADPAVDRLFARRWRDRAGHVVAGPAPDGPACPWLYGNLTLDARGRVMPCCAAPSASAANYVLGDVAEAESHGYNLPALARARAAFPDRERVDAPSRGAAGDPTLPFCARCTSVPPMAHELGTALRRDLSSLEPAGMLPPPLVAWLTS